MFTPIGNNIIVDPETQKEENITESGINLGTVADVSHQTVSSGKVVSVGKGVQEVQVGDEIIYEKHAAHSFEVRGIPYLSLGEINVIGFARD
jgi:co-chaperonin GroES (HSP10)